MENKTLQNHAREWVKLHDEKAKLDKLVKELEAKLSKEKEFIVKEIGSDEIVTLGKYTLKTWTQTTESIDNKRLKAENPAIWQEFRKPDRISQYASVTIVE